MIKQLLTNQNTMLTHTLKYAYFPGCVAQGACRELHQSTVALSQALGIELVELKKAACWVPARLKKILNCWKIRLMPATLP